MRDAVPPLLRRSLRPPPLTDSLRRCISSGVILEPEDRVHVEATLVPPGDDLRLELDDAAHMPCSPTPDGDALTCAANPLVLRKYAVPRRRPNADPAAKP